ncbi:YciI family protein [Saccharomonospora piscinae]|uniref:YciI family protein n=1 Tax=Saccharomonospora piscinae TaxID=687388 RepID=UPI000464510E|nr:YciI family protein [Saccharomonospora piscinae]
MKYLLSIYSNREVWDSLPEQVRTEIQQGHGEFIAAISQTGEFVSTDALDAPSSSAVVAVRDGVTTVTDGPFAESKEFLAGFYVVECESAERARAVAAMIPDAGVEGLAIEVRPIVFSDSRTG